MYLSQPIFLHSFLFCDELELEQVQNGFGITLLLIFTLNICFISGTGAQSFTIKTTNMISHKDIIHFRILQAVRNENILFAIFLSKKSALFSSSLYPKIFTWVGSIVVMPMITRKKIRAHQQACSRQVSARPKGFKVSPVFLLWIVGWKGSAQTCCPQHPPQPIQTCSAHSTPLNPPIPAQPSARSFLS